MIGAIRVLTVAQAVTFLLASLLHLGAPVPVLASAIGEPYMPQAGIPEGVIGLVLAAGAFAGFTGAFGGRRTLLATQAFAILGTLVGMFALAAGAAPRTDANEIYHRLVLGSLVVTLALSLAGRDAVTSFSGAGRPS